VFLSILTLHIYRHDDSRFISGSFFVGILGSQVKKFDEMIGSEQPENYQELYKDKPISEHDVIRQLTPEETPQNAN
jgi:hypothetical protein